MLFHHSQQTQTGIAVRKNAHAPKPMAGRAFPLNLTVEDWRFHRSVRRQIEQHVEPCRDGAQADDGEADGPWLHGACGNFIVIGIARVRVEVHGFFEREGNCSFRQEGNPHSARPTIPNCSATGSSCRILVGCRRSRKAFASICRMRSLVTPTNLPVSSKVSPR